MTNDKSWGQATPHYLSFIIGHLSLIISNFRDVTGGSLFEGSASPTRPGRERVHAHRPACPIAGHPSSNRLPGMATLPPSGSSPDPEDPWGHAHRTRLLVRPRVLRPMGAWRGARG